MFYLELSAAYSAKAAGVLYVAALLAGKADTEGAVAGVRVVIALRRRLRIVVSVVVGSLLISLLRLCLLLIGIYVLVLIRILSAVHIGIGVVLIVHVGVRVGILSRLIGILPRLIRVLICLIGILPVLIVVHILLVHITDSHISLLIVYLYKSDDQSDNSEQKGQRKVGAEAESNVLSLLAHYISYNAPYRQSDEH